MTVFAVFQSAGALAHSSHSQGITASPIQFSVAQNNTGLALEFNEPSGPQHHGSGMTGECCDVMAGSCITVGTNPWAGHVFPLKVALLVVPHPLVAGRVRMPEIELPPPRK